MHLGRLAGRLFMAAAIALGATGTAMAAEPIKVPVGKSKLMRLNAEPAIVVVGDPAVADVVVEEENVLFLVGLQPGETNIYVLDDDGNSLLVRDIVVHPIDGRHVTVVRGVEEATMSCNPRCTGVANPVGEGAVTQSNAAADAALSAANAGAGLNPLTGLTGQPPAGSETAPSPVDPSSVLNNLLSGALSGASQ